MNMKIETIMYSICVAYFFSYLFVYCLLTYVVYFTSEIKVIKFT